MAWNPFRRKPAGDPAEPTSGWLGNVQEGDRIMGRLGEEKSGKPYRRLGSLAEARQHADGAVILEADYGGQVLLTAPATAVACGEKELHDLLVDLAEMEWKDPDLGASAIYYERLPPGSPVWGGMGGGRIESEPWVHPDLFLAGVEPEVRDVLAGRLPRLVPETVDRETFMQAATGLETRLKTMHRDLLAAKPDDGLSASDVHSVVQKSRDPVDERSTRELALILIEYGLRAGDAVLGSLTDGVFEPWPERTIPSAVDHLRTVWSPGVPVTQLQDKFRIQLTFNGARLGHALEADKSPETRALLDALGRICMQALQGPVPRRVAEGEALRATPAGNGSEAGGTDRLLHRMMHIGVADGLLDIVDAPTADAPRLRWHVAVQRGMTQKNGPPCWLRNTREGGYRGNMEKDRQTRAQQPAV